MRENYRFQWLGDDMAIVNSAHLTALTFAKVQRAQGPGSRERPWEALVLTFDVSWSSEGSGAILGHLCKVKTREEAVAKIELAADKFLRAVAIVTGEA